jgi:MFS family permease
MLANCLAVPVAALMMVRFGRRTLMLFWTAVMTGILVMQTVATIESWGTVELAFTIAFVIAFEFGPGPIVWLYMSEIMNDKSVSIGVFTNWAFVLIVGAITPALFDSVIGPYTFVVFAGCSVIATVFIFLFMKETKGLSEYEVARLYRTDLEEIEEFKRESL